MFSREKKKEGGSWMVDKNEPLLEQNKKWYPMYPDMQEEVERAFQAWQLTLVNKKDRSWEGIRDTPNLPTLNKFLVGVTEAKEPGKDDRWQYEIDFQEMTQKNILLKIYRRIRR